MDDITNDQFSLEKFSPAKAEVMKVIEQAKKTDLTNIEQVHDNRIALRDLRVDITKRGKELRANALQFQKDVIAKENELVALVTPEEERLEAIEAEAKLKKQMESRREELPSRKAALATIGDAISILDEELLKLDDNEFNAYRLVRIEAKLAADRKAHEDKKLAEEAEARAKADAEARAQREKNAAEEARLANERREIEKEKARLQGAGEQRLKEEAARKAEAERKEAEARAETARKEAEAKAKVEAEAKVAAEEKFQAYLTSLKFDKATDDLVHGSDGSVQVWRLIGTYKPTK